MCSEFFVSDYFPFAVAAITVIGYISGAELYLNLALLGSVAVGVAINRSLIPLVPVASMMLFSVSPKNSPESHFGSEYYKNPTVIVALAIGGLAVIAVGIAVIVRKGDASRLKLGKMPMLRGSLLFAASLTLGGALSGEWEAENLWYGGLLVLCNFAVFYLFYLGLRGEGSERIIRSLCTTAAATALTLAAELGHLYLMSDSLIVGGKIIKEQVLFGWGMWTMAGQFMAVCIPLCFLGAMRRERWQIFLISATLAAVGAVFTLSRGALLIGGAVYICSFLIACRHGKNRKAMRRALAVISAVALVLFVLLRREIVAALSDYLERGFSDNGRFELWRHGMLAFLENPLLGKGIFGLQRELDSGTAEGFTFYPRMMHNTAVQLLGSSGIIGLISYAIYRAQSLAPFIRRPSVEKIMMLLTILVVLLGSLIDNFIFLPKHLIFYSITLAAAFATE